MSDQSPEPEDAPEPHQKTRRVFDGGQWIYVPEERAAEWSDKVWKAHPPEGGRSLNG